MTTAAYGANRDVLWEREGVIREGKREDGTGGGGILHSSHLLWQAVTRQVQVAQPKNCWQAWWRRPVSTGRNKSCPALINSKRGGHVTRSLSSIFHQTAPQSPLHHLRSFKIQQDEVGEELTGGVECCWPEDIRLFHFAVILTTSKNAPRDLPQLSRDQWRKS